MTQQSSVLDSGVLHIHKNTCQQIPNSDTSFISKLSMLLTTLEFIYIQQIL